ncbi:hypothetical protein MLD38_014330 [Melastoma candidum]|uniref:Uncharacterized protein n=1 Tax=Melastoma candidum TaxID=119954 RepID=A0ACB9RCJ1_9MYRT|nr:hypothetical protein MLD38_014330 [Melastoma candidum]
MSCAISCFAKSALLTLGQAKVIVLEIDANLLASSALVNMYGYAQNGLDLEAVNLYEKMLMDKVRPGEIERDRIHYEGLLQEYLREMLRRRVDGDSYYYLTLEGKIIGEDTTISRNSLIST